MHVPGQSVSGVVEMLEESVATVRIADNVVGELTSMHTTDHASLADKTFGRIKMGETLSNCLVLSSQWVANEDEDEDDDDEEGSGGEDGENRRGGRWVLQLTRKPMLLLRSAEEAPVNSDSIVPGQLLFGYVASVTHIGVFVRYGNTFTALAPRANLSDKFVAEPAEFFSKGQTVRSRVVDVDHETKRVIVTLKPRMCGVPGHEVEGSSSRSSSGSSSPDDDSALSAASSFFSGYLTERHTLGCSAGISADQDDEEKELAAETMSKLNSLEIGSVMTATITHKRDYGIILDLNGFAIFQSPQDYCVQRFFAIIQLNHHSNNRLETCMVISFCLLIILLQNSCEKLYARLE